MSILPTLLTILLLLPTCSALAGFGKPSPKSTPKKAAATPLRTSALLYDKLVQSPHTKVRGNTGKW